MKTLRTVKEIAALVGFDASTVHRHLRKADIPGVLRHTAASRGSATRHLTTADLKSYLTWLDANGYIVSSAAAEAVESDGGPAPTLGGEPALKQAMTSSGEPLDRNFIFTVPKGGPWLIEVTVRPAGDR